MITQMIAWQPLFRGTRRECFLTGTAMRRIAFAGTEARRSHIVYPGRNMSIALQMCLLQI